MTVDKEKIQKKIHHIKQNLSKLNELAKLTQDNFLEDYRNYDAAKYNLQISIEALIDIGNHIISRQNFRTPKTNADTFRVLSEAGILPENKLSIYLAMARFRNRVVHLYEEIDEKEIYRIIKEHLADIEYFVNIIVQKYLN